MENLNVIAGDSRDSSGLNRFFPLNPVDYLDPGHTLPEWYWQYNYYPTDTVFMFYYSIQNHIIHIFYYPI